MSYINVLALTHGTNREVETGFGGFLQVIAVVVEDRACYFTLLESGAIGCFLIIGADGNDGILGYTIKNPA
jgi:hypothetical protein